MSSYDLETRRLLCRERLDRLANDARRPRPNRRRRRRLMQAALSKLALGAAAYRAGAGRPSLEG